MPVTLDRPCREIFMSLGKYPRNKGSKSDNSNHRLWKANRAPHCRELIWNVKLVIYPLPLPHSLPKSLHFKEKHNMFLKRQSLYELWCSSVSLSLTFKGSKLLNNSGSWYM